MAIVSFGYILPAARGLHWKTIQVIQVYKYPTGTQICNLAEHDQNKILFARLWQRPAWHGCIHGMKRVQVWCEKNLMSILKVLLFWPPFWFNLISGSQTPKDWENALAGSMQNRLRSSYSSGAREKWKGCESWGVRTWALCMFIFFLWKSKDCVLNKKPVFWTSLAGQWSKQHLMVKSAPSRVEGIYIMLINIDVINETNIPYIQERLVSHWIFLSTHLIIWWKIV